METIRRFRTNYIGLYLCAAAAAISFTYCDARSSIIKSTEKFKVLKRSGIDSLAPIPSPDIYTGGRPDPPYCLCPPQPPSPSTIPIQTPPPPPFSVIFPPLPGPTPSPQQYFPYPNPQESAPSPSPSPPKNYKHPSPTEPTFSPPAVFQPPPTRGPPPPQLTTRPAQWCVAKPSVPEPIIQEAMNYACESGADCDSIQPNESCFEPNTVIAHASYAFNSYWQTTKAGGGTCEFGGAAMLVSIDPSDDGCHFIYY